jgi:very-short-patch-repair endonuclease/Zn finger protein HypA/HybF involved in hydrogenase expression
MFIRTFEDVDVNKVNFIKKSNIIHNGKYDYSKVEYINARTHVKIICPLHGEFYQLPYNHTLGKGCKNCAIHLNSDNLKKTKEQFVKDAMSVHGDKYIYNNSKYINDSTKIEIECPLHGTFSQVPNKHLQGNGCPGCKIQKTKDTNRSKHTLIFPKKSSQIHNNYYDYSKVNYKNSRTPVEIICPKHGSFFTIPCNHLLGRGCPICSQSYGEKKIEGFLINKNINYERQKKFDDCRNKSPLSFDFWIESKNILIEFDGQQHYKAFGYSGGVEKLEYTKLCDSIKNKYCFEKGINLIRIPYWEINQIDSILSQYI